MLGDALRCLQPPKYIRRKFEADAGQVRSLTKTSQRLQASRSKNWLEQIDLCRKWSKCNEENFTEARLSPHTATGPNAIYLSLCQPAATVRLHHRFGELGNQNSGRKGCLISTLQMTCMSPAFFRFHLLHWVWNLVQVVTRSFTRNMWRAQSGDGQHMQWREFHGGAAVTAHSDWPQCHLSQPLSACSDCAIAP